MNWRKILLLSLLSLPVTLLSIYGFIHSPEVEAVVWLLVGLGIAWVLRSAAKPFLSGFACGVLMAFLSHLLSMGLWDTYVANNLAMSEQISTAAVSKNMSVQVFLLVTAAMVGLMYGTVLGLLAWGASKVARRG